MPIMELQKHLFGEDWCPCAAALDPGLIDAGGGLFRPGPPVGRPQLGSVRHQQRGNLAWRQASADAEQGDPKLNQVIEPVSHPIAAPHAELVALERHSELPQVPKLIE